MPPGWPGGAVWGSSPAVDTRRGQVYVATGDNYDIPQSSLDCVALAGNDPVAQRACFAPGNYIDSILALDLKTGAIRWATAALPFDAWTDECIFGFNPQNCPEPAGLEVVEQPHARSEQDRDDVKLELPDKACCNSLTG